MKQNKVMLDINEAVLWKIKLFEPTGDDCNFEMMINIIRWQLILLHDN